MLAKIKQSEKTFESKRIETKKYYPGMPGDLKEKFAPLREMYIEIIEKEDL